MGALVVETRSTYLGEFDSEKSNEVNGLQASTLISLAGNPSTIQDWDSDVNHNYHPTMLPAAGRAMTAPVLSFADPSSDPTIYGTTKTYIVQNAGVTDALEDDLSDAASSICHSPGWDDLSGKKRKKEKREAKERKKKEKEKAEAASKQENKPKHRLSKAPPNSNSRFVNRIAIADRSISEPAVPSLQNGVESSPKLKPAEEGRRSRRGSLDLGIRSLMTVAAVIPNPWKSTTSTHAPVVQDVTASSIQARRNSRESFSHGTSSRSSVDGSGFIGGLKLRQAEEADIQQTIRQVTASKHENGQAVAHQASHLPQQWEETQVRGSNMETSESTPSADAGRSSDRWDQIYTNAAKLASQSSSIKDLESDGPIMERNIRKSRVPPPTLRSLSVDTNAWRNDGQDTSLASTRTTISVSRPESRATEQRTGSSTIMPQQSSDAIPQHPLSRESELIEISRGRKGTNNVRHEQQHSRDLSTSRFRNQSEVSESRTSRNESRGRRMSFGRSRQHDSNDNRESSNLRHTTWNNRDDREIDQERGVMGPARGDAHNSPSTPGQHMRSPVSSRTSSHHRKSSSRSGLRGLRAAAKHVFSKSFDAPVSPPSDYPESSSPLDRPHTSNRAGTTESSPVSTSNKTERVVPREEQNTKPAMRDYTQRSYSSTRQLDSPDSLKHLNGSNSAFNEFHGRAVPLEASTDSSEEYSTFDGFSNITTPAVSRPSSQKNNRPLTNESSPEIPQLMNPSSESAYSESPVSPPLMTGALVYNVEDASIRDSWCRTAKEFEVPDDEDRVKTPTAKKHPVTNFSAPFAESLPPPVPALTHRKSLELRRKPSMPRSVSTSDGQDLSFLPALKHQALNRLERDKEKERVRSMPQLSKGDNHSPLREGETLEQNSLVRPPLRPLTTTEIKSDGALTTASSQYLHSARLNLPRGKAHSPTASPPGMTPPHGGAEPIAKMFVVCCSCKYFHDMPSKIYECMAKPDNVVTDANLGVSGIISTSVKCPWCGHGMSTTCCAGYAAVVYLREKFH